MEGRKIWEERGYGVGTVILVADKLVVLSDRGELAIVNASSKGFDEIARFQVLGGKNNWTPPPTQMEECIAGRVQGLGSVLIWKTQSNPFRFLNSFQINPSEFDVPWWLVTNLNLT